MKFVINEETNTLEDVYQYLSGLGQKLYDDLSEKEKRQLDKLLNGLTADITPSLIDEIFISHSHLFREFPR